MNLSEKLKALRIRNNCTQKEFAVMINMAWQSYQRLEYGKHIPSDRVFIKLCNQCPEYALWLMSDDIDVGTVENKTLKNNQYLTDELPSDVLMRFSKKIKTLRSNKGWTQKKFSKLLGIRHRSYQSLEYGDTSPSGLTLKKLCNQCPEYALWLMSNDIDVENIKNQVLKQS